MVAESDDTVVVEGNHYFPHDAIRAEHFRPSDKHTTCPWKGVASYYDIIVGDAVNKDAAWYYPQVFKPLLGDNIEGLNLFRDYLR